MGVVVHSSPSKEALMSKYRTETMDLATRMQVGAHLILPAQQRGWGLVTDYAERFGVSRQTLYRIRNQTQEALAAALSPKKPGRKGHQGEVTVNRQFIQKATATMAVMPGSIRGIQTALELLFGVQRSVGSISLTLQQAGRAAATMNADLTTALPVLAEADEIFQGGKPCLTVVDGRTFLVLNLEPADSRTADDWGITFLELSERGLRFQDVVSDGARGIRAGVEAAELGAPSKLDLFHLLRQGQAITRRLERSAFEAIETTDRVRRAVQEQTGGKRRRGRPLSVSLSLEEAQAAEHKAVVTHDLWCWLLREVRCSLEPITPTYQFTFASQARSTIQTAAELMRDLDRKDMHHFAQALLDRLDDILAPLAWLESRWQPWHTVLEPADHAFILWAWRHRQSLSVSLEDDFPPDLQPAAQVFWTIMSLFHRASSLAEGLHSWLRPHLVAHRGMPQWLLPLLQLYWNHHPFQRGKRAGASPLQLAGDPNALSLPDAFQRLFANGLALDAYSPAC